VTDVFIFFFFTSNEPQRNEKYQNKKNLKKNFRLLHRRLRRRRSPGDYWLEEGGAKLHAITANCSNRGSF
jgi:hypothetical protein